MSSNQITLPNNINVELHNDGTATVVKSPDSAGEIVIQKSVKHENKEYIITLEQMLLKTIIMLNQ